MSNKTPKDSPEKTVSAPNNSLFLVIAFVVLCIAGGVYYLFNQPVERTFDTSQVCRTNPGLPVTTLEANNVKVMAETVTSDADKQLGLSGRGCLADDHAMLFSYERAGDYCFWMKDMNFTIDMIWLDGDKKIVTIKANVAPETYPQSFCPSKPAQYIIETRANKAADSGWQTNTQFTF